MATTFVLQGCYYNGNGWEDLTVETTRTAIKERLKEYNENEARYMRVNYRIIKRATPAKGNTHAQA